MNCFFQTITPISSDYTVIIPYISSQEKFDREAYSSAMTGGRASAEEIDQVLRLIEAASHGMSTPEKLFKTWCFRFLLPFIFLLIFQINGNLRYPQCFWGNFLAYVIIGNIWLFIMTTKNNSKVKENVKSVLKLYQDAFEKKGLRWHVPVNFPLYVELFKDYREQQCQFSIPVNQYQPVSVEKQETTTIDKPLLQK